MPDTLGETLQGGKSFPRECGGKRNTLEDIPSMNGEFQNMRGFQLLQLHIHTYIQSSSYLSIL